MSNKKEYLIFLLLIVKNILGSARAQTIETDNGNNIQKDDNFSNLMAALLKVCSFILTSLNKTSKNNQNPFIEVIVVKTDKRDCLTIFFFEFVSVNGALLLS
jgi:hypothetical protein